MACTIITKPNYYEIYYTTSSTTSTAVNAIPEKKFANCRGCGCPKQTTETCKYCGGVL